MKKLALAFGNYKRFFISGRTFYDTLTSITDDGWRLKDLIEYLRPGYFEDNNNDHEDAVALLEQMLELDPKVRCTSTDALEKTNFLKP